MEQRPEEILKKARERKKLTQSDVAKKVGITIRQYHKYESGQFPKYKSDSIQKIDELLGTKLFELIYEQNIPQDAEISGQLALIIRDQNEKIIRLEAYVEVYESAIAGLLSETKSDFTKIVGELREQVQAAVNRRFDELYKKSGKSS